MSVLEVEDLTGSIEVVAFPDAYESSSELFVDDAILKFVAKVDERGEKLQLILDQASPDLPAARKPEVVVAPVVIVIPTSSEVWDDITAMQRIDEVLQRHDGNHPVEIRVESGPGVRRFRSRTRLVEWTDDLKGELATIVGESGVYLEDLPALVLHEDEFELEVA